MVDQFEDHSLSIEGNIIWKIYENDCICTQL